jgi:hypothetical protein
MHDTTPILRFSRLGHDSTKDCSGHRHRGRLETVSLKCKGNANCPLAFNRSVKSTIRALNYECFTLGRTFTPQTPAIPDLRNSELFLGVSYLCER